LKAAQIDLEVTVSKLDQATKEILPSVIFSSRLVTIAVHDDQLVINQRAPVPFGDLVSIRARGWTVHKDNIFKRTRHGRVTVEWAGENEGLQVIEFAERGGDRKAEALRDELIEVTRFQTPDFA
jgi:hypothetical protein